jgi:hypothetical protein
MTFKMQSPSDKKLPSTELLAPASAGSQSYTPMAKDEKFIDSLRKVVRDYLDIHCYDTALFWADKVNVLCKDSLKDFYMFVHCLYCCGQYQRALNLVKDNDLHRRNSLFRYIAAKCHLASKGMDIKEYEGTYN